MTRLPMPYGWVKLGGEGRLGTHVDVAFSHRTFDAPSSEFGSYQFPGCDHSLWSWSTRSSVMCGRRAIGL